MRTCKPSGEDSDEGLRSNSRGHAVAF